MDFVTDAFNSLVALQAELDRLHRHPGGGAFVGLSGAGVFPPINIFRDKKDDGLVIRAELPGLTPDSITVALERRRVTISGERKHEHEGRGAYHRRERSFGRFSRSITVPEDLDVEKAVAHWRNGVLTLRIPPLAEAKPRHITVQAA